MSRCGSRDTDLNVTCSIIFLNVCHPYRTLVIPFMPLLDGIVARCAFVCTYDYYENIRNTFFFLLTRKPVEYVAVGGDGVEIHNIMWCLFNFVLFHISTSLSLIQCNASDAAVLWQRSYSAFLACILWLSEWSRKLVIIWGKLLSFHQFRMSFCIHSSMLIKMPTRRGGEQMSLRPSSFQFVK